MLEWSCCTRLMLAMSGDDDDDAVNMNAECSDAKREEGMIQ